MRLLLVEDSEDDASLVRLELERAGFAVTCKMVDTAPAMRAALDESVWDIVVSDHSMPSFSAPQALTTLKESGLDIPFIILSGSIGEELAVQAMKSGAADFILKQSLKKLPVALARELREARVRQEKKEAEAQLREAEERYRLLVEHIPAVTYVATLADDRTIVFISPQIEVLTGYPPERWISDTNFWSRCIHPEDRERVRDELRQIRGVGGAFSSCYRVMTKEGRVAWWHDSARILRDHGSDSVLVRGLVEDITDRVQAEETIRHLAYHERVTDLPNRTYIEHMLQDQIDASRGIGKPVAVVIIGFDGMGDVMRTLGHRDGNALTSEVATRLRAVIGTEGTLGQFGADKFVVLLPGTDESRAEEFSAKVHGAMSDPILVAGIPIEIDAVAGIAFYPGHGEDSDGLLRKAVAALEVAVHKGRAICVYDSAEDPYSERRLQLLGEIRKGIDDNELFLQYQPKISLAANRLCGVEALVRWNHPSLGTVPPIQFIGPVEQTGLIKPLTRWVVGRAVSQCHAWRQGGLELAVAVNLSARNIQDPQLPDMVAGMLSTWGLDPRLLEVEITESALISDLARSKEALERIHALGVKIAIDDFGTGYSSLSHLRSLPVSEIKIDQSFVARMTSSNDDLAIVRSSIDLAHNLGLTVVAEGVEDAATWERLAELGCDIVQGFYIARPMNEDALRRWVAGRRESSQLAEKATHAG